MKIGTLGHTKQSCTTVPVDPATMGKAGLAAMIQNMENGTALSPA